MKSRTLQYLVENPVKSGATLLFISGSLLLFMFFLRIEFLPDIDIKSISSVLYAIALLGLFLATYTMVMLVAPGFLLAEAKKQTSGLLPRHVFLVAMTTIGCWAIVIFALYEVPGFPRGRAAMISIGAIVLCMPYVFLFWLGLKPEGDPSMTRRDRYGKAYAWSTATAALLFLLTVAPMSLIGVIGLTGDIRTASGAKGALLISCFPMMIIAGSVLIGSAPGLSPLKAAAIIAPVLLFFVLLVTGSFSAFSTIAIKALGQGEITASRIAIDGSTCGEINAALGYEVCMPGGEKHVTAICPVMIRSRIGAQAVLEFSYMHARNSDMEQKRVFWITTTGAIDGNPGVRITRRIIIDKDKILSWQPLKGFGERDESEVGEKNRRKEILSWMPLQKCQSSSGLDRALCSLIAERCGVRPSTSVTR
ncbi:hypothetical protein [Massilia sp. METH4]|uniref:hypothetical protein n=1 Tax=Massilia sp. METH4 TaxID=3123041 RepID=UPI0030D0D3A2